MDGWSGAHDRDPLYVNRNDQRTSDRLEADNRAAAMAARGADLPLPAALRVLLQPGLLPGAPPRTRHPRVARRAQASARARRRATWFFGRRTARARGPRSARRRG